MEGWHGNLLARRQKLKMLWRKLHLGINAATLKIRAMEVTDTSIGDTPLLPNLLGKILPEEQLASVSGNGAYDTKGCHEAIVLRQTDAIISIRKKAKPWKTNRTGVAA